MFLLRDIFASVSLRKLIMRSGTALYSYIRFSVALWVFCLFLSEYHAMQCLTEIFTMIENNFDMQKILSALKKSLFYLPCVFKEPLTR